LTYYFQYAIAKLALIVHLLFSLTPHLREIFLIGNCIIMINYFFKKIVFSLVIFSLFFPFMTFADEKMDCNEIHEAILFRIEKFKISDNLSFAKNNLKHIIELTSSGECTTLEKLGTTKNELEKEFFKVGHREAIFRVEEIKKNISTLSKFVIKLHMVNIRKLISKKYTTWEKLGTSEAELEKIIASKK